MEKKIIFRVDGHSQMGLGHVVRSLSLADMLRDDFDCQFVSRASNGVVVADLVRQHNYTFTNLPGFDSPEMEVNYFCDTFLNGKEIVVLDGYHFDVDYQQAIKKVGSALVCIDDIFQGHFLADVVINHAPGISAKDYLIAEETKLCLGPDYALLRSPFLQAATEQREITEIETIFICFGGSDFNNLSLKILKLFSSFKSKRYDINMVLGGANKYKEKVKAFAQTITDFDVHVYENLDGEEMVAVMKKSDCAIVPASSIMYEVLSVKMPVIGGYYVDNQVNIYHGFSATKFIEGVGDLNEFVDYESALALLTKEKISAVIKMQERIGIAQAKNNLLNIFKKLSHSEKISN